VSFYGVKLHRSDVLRLDEHPEACTRDTFAEWCEARTRSGGLLAVDLFSGAGGLSLGLEEAGWTVACSVDSDQRALQTHRANFPGLALNVDLGDKDEREDLIALLRTAEIDLVAGGPPCQPFSRAGRSKIRSLVAKGVRDAVDERKELWRAFVDVVLRVRPRAVLMENVPDMALGDDFAVVRQIIHELESDGYATEVRLVDAWRYGVPQLRKRLILLARLDSDDFTWPDEQAMPKVHLREAISDLPVIPESPFELSVGARDLPYEPTEPPSAFVRMMRKEVPEANVVHDHMTRPVRPDDLETFKLMDHRTLYSEIPESLRRYNAEDYDDKYKRLNWDDFSRSVTAHIAKDGYWYIHPEQNRTLSVREAARVQTFPDHFRFAGTRSDAFRQIGNAVPPILGRAAAQALAMGDRGRHREDFWEGLHERLAGWGREQRDRHWYLYPGPDVDRAAAVAVTLLRPGRGFSGELARRLDVLKGEARLRKTHLNTITKGVQAGDRAMRRLDRVADLTRKRTIWDDDDALAAELGFGNAETEFYELLMGADVMLSSQAGMRVASRVLGRDVSRNRLTDGRVALARVVGGGEEAPVRMAAVRQIGVTNCLPAEPLCVTCPVVKWCEFAKKNQDDQKLY
jgi:DNA (cytosine-5)-methyltransferase 1